MQARAVQAYFMVSCLSLSSRLCHLSLFADDSFLFMQIWWNSLIDTKLKSSTSMESRTTDTLTCVPIASLDNLKFNKRKTIEGKLLIFHKEFHVEYNLLFSLASCARTREGSAARSSLNFFQRRKFFISEKEKR